MSQHSSDTVKMFLNGGGMRGGSVHHHIEGIAEFAGEVRTAPKYRFYSVRDEFPGIHLVGDGGHAVVGELYKLPLGVLRDRLLPAEPVELELSIIELEDGSASLSMVMREAELHSEGVVDISTHGAWRTYKQSLARH